MFNYCVYGYFNEEVTNHLSTLMTEVQDKYADVLAYRVSEKPHITICYGPSIDNAADEITSFNKAAINDLLGSSFLDKYQDGGTAECKGISVFDRQAIKGFSVVKVEFECEVLSAMRDDLYSQGAMKARREKEHQDLQQSGVPDETFAPVAKRWAHATLAVVKDASKVDEIVAFATSRLFVASISPIEKVALISAVNDIPIDLF